MAENPPSIKLDLACEYLRTEISHWGSYHNHKEQMAYGATALFLTGATALCLVQLPRFAICSFIVWCLFVHILLITMVAGIAFVGWQLHLRELAADMQMACGMLAVKWISTQPGRSDLRLAESPDGRPILQALSNQVRDLPKRRWREDPRVARWLTITVMVIWGLAALGRVLFAGFSCMVLRRIG